MANTGLLAGALWPAHSRRQSPQDSSPGDRVTTCSLDLLEALSLRPEGPVQIKQEPRRVKACSTEHTQCGPRADGHPSGRALPSGGATGRGRVGRARA